MVTPISGSRSHRLLLGKVAQPVVVWAVTQELRIERVAELVRTTFFLCQPVGERSVLSPAAGGSGDETHTEGDDQHEIEGDIHMANIDTG